MERNGSELARYIQRYRSSLLGGIASAAVVALTLDQSSSAAHSSFEFALWFAMIATLIAVVLTGMLSIAEYRAARPAMLPKATARPRRTISVEFIDN
ncbi:MAG TPA: hypothetical protein VMZ53_13150 [Kofleriaceae bacterium]|nr:hypothetical protein [Kofleriaceae bacterium]